MSGGPTTVHITLLVTVGAFSVAALALILGFFLIEHGTTGAMSLEIQSGNVKVNLFTFVPGVGFGFFGAAIAWKALSALVGNGSKVLSDQVSKA